MYKKRLAKWGFQKNIRRSPAASPALGTGEQDIAITLREPCQHESQISRLAWPHLCINDAQTLTVLSSVRQWSTAFFESLQMPAGSVTLFQHRPSAEQLELEKTKEVGLVLKLAAEALTRGRGRLAGRMARKAFILIETMFDLDGPALAWNLLVILYDTVIAQQVRLFEMLLAHLLSLACCRMPKSHPLLAMLSTLQKIALQPGSWVRHHSSPSTESILSSSTCSSPQQMTTTAIDPKIHSNTLGSLLQRAWTLNAELIFNHLDIRLFQVYTSVDWDSSSMTLPVTMVEAASKWFSRMEAQDNSRATTAPPTRGTHRPMTDVDGDMMLQHFLTIDIRTLSLREYEILWASSIAALRRHWDACLQEEANFRTDTGILIRALAGLSTATIIQDSLTTVGTLTTAANDTPRIPRLHARHLAFVLEATEDLRRIRASTGSTRLANSIQRRRVIVALCEYAYGETDPRVVQQMLSLQDALIAGNDHSEAERVGDEVSCRLEQYIRHIPSDAM